jgi:hypothetical protein
LALSTYELESSMSILLSSSTVYYCCGDGVGIVWVSGADGDCLSFEVDVSVSGAGVRSGPKDNNIRIVGIVYCSLDRGIVACTVCIDVNYSTCAGRVQERCSQQKGHPKLPRKSSLAHFSNLQSPSSAKRKPMPLNQQLPIVSSGEISCKGALRNQYTIVPAF